MHELPPLRKWFKGGQASGNTQLQVYNFTVYLTP
jgi:hypothetical protein